MKKVKPTYTQIENDCKNIYNQIKKENYFPDIILGISVGGFFPAIHLSRLLDNKNLSSISVRSYSKEKQGKLELLNFPSKKFLKGKKVLVVDEIIDSGKTIKFVVSLLKEKYSVKEVKTASIYVHKVNSAFYPNFYAKTNKDWLVFPWDRFEKV